MVCLSTESVKGLSLALESVDDVHGSDGLSAGVLGVGDGITNDVLEEDLEDTTGFFVDQSRDTLDTTSTRKTTDSRLGNTLDVVTKDLSVTLGASLSESLSSFSSSGHGECSSVWFGNVNWLVLNTTVLSFMTECGNTAMLLPSRNFRTGWQALGVHACVSTHPIGSLLERGRL